MLKKGIYMNVFIYFDIIKNISVTIKENGNVKG